MAYRVKRLFRIKSGSCSFELDKGIYKDIKLPDWVKTHPRYLACLSCKDIEILAAPADKKYQPVEKKSTGGKSYNESDLNETPTDSSKTKTSSTKKKKKSGTSDE